MIVVTRHTGALDWFERRGTGPLRRLDHVGDAEIESFSAGDIVAGTLPVNVVARLNARGVRYLHLTLELPAALRGKELTADDMDAAGARLEEYAVRRVG